MPETSAGTVKTAIKITTARRLNVQPAASAGCRTLRGGEDRVQRLA
jgi:hypothetical protein